MIESFDNYHPFYRDWFIPYLDRNGNLVFGLDWPKYWKRCQKTKNIDLDGVLNGPQSGVNESLINELKDFVRFSREHPKWNEEFDWPEEQDICGFKDAALDWLKKRSV